MKEKRSLLKADPSIWPKHVDAITVDEMEGLGIGNKDNNLYWHGKPVQTQLKLLKLELTFLFFGALGAFIGGVSTAIILYMDYFNH